MHRQILGAAAALALGLSPALAAMGAACPGPQAALVERFTSADCSSCWSQPPRDAEPEAWVLDWLLPAGEQAPLAAAALPEALERLQRLGQPRPAAARSARQPAGSSTDLHLIAQAGPAWLGRTMAFEFIAQASAALPPGATGWLAMVELLPAGAEGSPVARALVRHVAGPLNLDGLQPGGAALSHLRAMRWPDGADPTRLAAYAWVELADGRVLAISADRCATP